MVVVLPLQHWGRADFLLNSTILPLPHQTHVCLLLLLLLLLPLPLHLSPPDSVAICADCRWRSGSAHPILLLFLPLPLLPISNFLLKRFVLS